MEQNWKQEAQEKTERGPWSTHTSTKKQGQNYKDGMKYSGEKIRKRRRKKKHREQKQGPPKQ